MSSTRSLIRPSCRQHVRSYVRHVVNTFARTFAHVVNTFTGTSVPHSYPPVLNLSKTIINETLKKANQYLHHKAQVWEALASPAQGVGAAQVVAGAAQEGQQSEAAG